MSHKELQHISLVVNPSAGSGRAERLLPRVADQIHASMPQAVLDVRRSTSYSDAEHLCADAVAQGTGALLVMGGDGMAHIGLNACATTEIPLGVIPAGTGNDFCRGVGIPRRVGPAVRAAISGRTRRIDLTELVRADGSVEFVGSVVSTGYDARVNRRTNSVSSSFGPFSNLAYAGVALAELAIFRPLTYRLEIDGMRHEQEAMFVAVANAGFFGGGMQVCPAAHVDDGLLDLVVANPMSRGTLLKLLPRIFSGNHVSHPAVEQLRATRVTIDGDGLFAMADGEEMGPVPVEAVCRPGALSVFTA